MKKLTLLSALIALAGIVSAQTTINGGRTILGAWDASGATTTKPVKTGTSDPASCAVGELFYRTDTATLKHCSALNTWTDVGGSYTLPTASASVLGGVKVGTNLSIDGSGVLSASGGSSTCDPFDLTLYCMVEDFASGNTTSGGVGAAGMRFDAVTSGSVSYHGINSLGDYNHPGIAKITSTTTANSGGNLRLNATAANPFSLYTWLNGTWEIRWIAKLDTTADARVRIGLNGTGAGIVAATGEPAFIFRYDTDAAFADNTKNTTGSWVAQFCGYSSTTCADTAGVYKVLNITPDANWHQFSVRNNGSGTITWKLDNTDVATMCAAACDMTTPTISNPAGANPASPGIQYGTSGTTARILYIDYLSAKISGAFTRY